MKTIIATSALALALAASAQAGGMRACGRVTDHRTGYPWYITANDNTSCSLARNVGRAAQYNRDPIVFSPITGRYYRFACYRSGHTYTYNRYSCISFDGTDGELKVVMRG